MTYADNGVSPRRNAEYLSDSERAALMETPEEIATRKRIAQIEAGMFATRGFWTEMWADLKFQLDRGDRLP